MQRKGCEFVEEIVERFPDLRRPSLPNSLFDFRTGKIQIRQSLISKNDRYSRAPAVGPTQLYSERNDVNYQQIVQSMGYDPAIIHRVTER